MKSELLSGLSGTTRLESFPGGFQRNYGPLAELTPALTRGRPSEPQVSLLCTSKCALFDYMQALCDSLTKQQDFNFELIVVCRSSVDYQLWVELVKNYSFHALIHRDYNSKNRAQAFKVAAELSRAPWSYVVDADDFLPENAIPYAFWVTGRFPQFRVFCSNHAECDEQGNAFQVNKYDPHDQRPESLSLQFRQRHLWGFHRDLVTYLSELLDSPYICEDYWFFTRLAMHNEPVMHLPRTLYCYRRHPLQMRQVYSEDMSVMTEAIRIEMHRWMCGRPIGCNFGDQVMAERIVKTAKTLL